MDEVTTARNKWALLIGIDLYPNLPGSDLSGCVADVMALSQLLNDRFAFPIENITILVDQQATRDSILGAFQDLTERVGKDDVVVISYSGHGSQVPSADGDEADGLDETLVAHDSGRGAYPNRDIVDDEIQQRLRQLGLTTPHITVIFDCCHSGSGVRDAFGDRSRGIPPDLRVPAARARAASVRAVSAGQEQPGTAQEAGRPRYVFISGCRDEERSYEYTAQTATGSCTHGALTYFLTRELSRATASDTIRDVFERASAQVTAARPAQHPQIEGNLNSAVLGVDSFDPIPSVRLRDRRGPQVLLDAGLVHGITPGSQWAVYVPGSEKAGAAQHPLGVLEVKSVGPAVSMAVIVSESSAAAITPGTRAVEQTRSFLASPLLVELAQPAPDYAAAMAELEAQLRDSRLVKLSTSGDATVRVYALPARLRASAGEPVPQLEQLPEPSWVAVGSDGALLMAPLPLADPAKQLVLLGNLEKLARQRVVMATDNVDPQNPLGGKLALEIWKKIGTRWEPVARDPAGQFHFVEGDRIAISITNSAPVPLYINLLSLGVTGSIELLYPPPGSQAQLLPGKTLEIGRRDGEEIELFLPEGYPFSGASNQASAIQSTEYIKVFASQQEANFTALLQGGVHREIPVDSAGAAQPAQILAGLLSGQRDMRVKKTEQSEAWITLTYSAQTTRPAAPWSGQSI